MHGNEINQEWWIMDSNEGSIDNKFESLRINQSLESGNEEGFAIARGNPGITKPNSQCGAIRKTSHSKKTKTSSYVLPILQIPNCNLDESDTSGCYSSQSTEASLYNVFPSPPVFPVMPQTRFQYEPIQIRSSDVSKRIVLKDILAEKLRRKFPLPQEKFILEFRDTHLIKSCRIGDVTRVEEAILQLLKNYQFTLINHKNSAHETALSIATYQINEKIIRLLMKYDASPILPLTMRNNVLHLAAAMTDDVDRRALRHLINAINEYQPNILLPALTSRNIYNFDVCQVLQLHQDMIIDDMYAYQCLQSHIESIQYLLSSNGVNF